MMKLQELRKEAKRTQDLKEFIWARVDERKDEFPKEFSDGLDFTLDIDYKIFISRVFEAEKGGKYTTLNQMIKCIEDWIQGLCFISPIMEDLSQYSRCKTEERKEQDVINRMINIIWG